MIKLSNGMEFDAYELRLFIQGMRETVRYLSCVEQVPAKSAIREGRNYALSTAIAAVEVAIENAELALKSAQQKETKMKACKKAVKPVAKKPAVKKPVAKKAAGKKK